MGDIVADGAMDTSEAEARRTSAAAAILAAAAIDNDRDENKSPQ
jgi:hypothetical protein